MVFVPPKGHPLFCFTRIQVWPAPCPHPALEVSVVSQAWEQTAELSLHGTSIASFLRSCSIDRMSAGNCWRPSRLAREGEANKEERKRRVCLQQHTPCASHHQVGIFLTCPGQLHPSLWWPVSPPALACRSPVFLAILWPRGIACGLPLSVCSRGSAPALQDGRLFSHLEDDGFCQILVVLNKTVLNVHVSCLGCMLACGQQVRSPVEEMGW